MNIITTENSNTNATNIMAMIDSFDPDTLGVEDRLKYDRFVLAQSKDMDSERRSEVSAIERAEKKAVLAIKARNAGVFKAVDKFLVGDNISVRVVIVREKNSKGAWEYDLGGIPSATKGDKFLPGGKDLKFRYQGTTILNTVDTTKTPHAQVDKPRGANHAALALCKAINLDVGKDSDGKSSSPGTSLRRQLENVDGDGNPAGKSFKRTQLEQVEIQHPSIANGTWTKLTDYFLDWVSPDEEEDEEEAGSEE